MTTGVTDFITIGEVRQEIDSTYPNPGSDVESELEVPNNGYSHKLIGDSFEFLCKLWLYRHCDKIVRPQRRVRWGGEGGEKREWVAGEIPPLTVTVFDGMEWEKDIVSASSKEEWEERNENRPAWEGR